MTTLNTRSFQTATQIGAAAVQSRSTDLVDFSVGSILLALVEAVATDGLWLQALVAQTLAAGRLSSCFGTDVDTFCAQYMPVLPNTATATTPAGSPRLQAVAATTPLTFYRITASATSPFVPVGSSAKTQDGTQPFVVYADPTNANYSAAANGYYMPSGASQMVVPAQAANPGSQGNVAAGTISSLNSTFQSGGIDGVTNAAAVTNGVDSESDAALKTRFQAFIAQLSKGTEAAITFAIQSLQAGLQVKIHSNFDPSGNVSYGLVTVYVDDGSGSPPTSTVSAANVAANNVKAAGVRVGVYGASTLVASVVMTLGVDPSYSRPVVVGQVGAALSAYINGLGLENTLPYSRLSSVAYSVPGVTNVTGVTLNGGTADLTPAWGQTVKAAAPTVS